MGSEVNQLSKRLYAISLRTDDEKKFVIRDTLAVFRIGDRIKVKFNPDKRECIAISEWDNSATIIMAYHRPKNVK
jgi:hypothetical protein